MFGRRGRRYFYWSRHIAKWEFIGVALLFAIPFLFAPIISFDYSDYAASHNGASYADYQYQGQFKQSVFFCVLSAFHWFVATFHDDIDALSTFVIAAFTVILAWSTVRLWRETEKLAKGAEGQSADMKASIAVSNKAANAAELSAKAAIGVELPVLYVGYVSSNLAIEESEWWVRNFVPLVRMTNYGRSPAFLGEIVVNVLVDNQLTLPLEYKILKPFPEADVIKYSDMHEYREYLYKADESLTAEQIAKYLAGEFRIYVFGYINYRDFLNASHRKHFCYFKHTKTDRFLHIPSLQGKGDY